MAELPQRTGATRALSLILFDKLSPLGNYPQHQGYQQLAIRLIKDMQDAKKWGDIVPYVSAMWRTCNTADDARYPRVADALTSFAEAAMEAGNYSVAILKFQLRR